MRQVVSWLVLSCAGCSAVPTAVPQGFRPSEVTELAALPPGYVAGEVVRVGCSTLSGARAFTDEPLGAVECSFARLSRVLRARAGEMSARVIVDKRCRSRAGERRRLECSATLARPGQHVSLAASSQVHDAGPAPSAEQVRDLDEPRPQDQERIRVDFWPAASAPRAQRFAPRDYAAVDETRLPSVGRQELGQVSARCEDCEQSALHHALRVTAGHVGAGEVASVRCFQEADGLRCVATALAPWSS
jgi:hypothetical protein